MMSKWRLALCACAAMALSAPASAKPFLVPTHDAHPASDPEPDAETSGQITSVNVDTRSITLVDGHRFKIPGWINFNQLRAGEMVSVVYTPNPHKNTTAVKTVTII